MMFNSYTGGLGADSFLLQELDEELISSSSSRLPAKPSPVGDSVTTDAGATEVEVVNAQAVGRNVALAGMFTSVRKSIREVEQALGEYIRVVAG